jgi:hypothetical protein
MTLTDSQKDQARRWLADGMKLSEFQKQLEKEFKLQMTYMEVRFLVDDLKVLPKDAEPAVKPEPVPPVPLPVVPEVGEGLGEGVDDAGVAPAATPNESGSVELTVDPVTRPGTIVSGRVKFSDGQMCGWYLDQRGALGLAPETKGYRPPNSDLQQFQIALERELMKLGL